MIFLAVLLFLASWACGYFGLHPIATSIRTGEDLTNAETLLSIVLLAFWMILAVAAGKAFSLRD